MLDVLGHILAYPYYSRPVFVIGAGRSGTTALTHALGNHPRILAIERECPFIAHVGRLSYYIEPERFGSYYQENMIASNDDVIRGLARLSFESCRGKNFGIADSLRSISGGDFTLLKSSRWCAKTFPNHEEFLGLRRLFPKARFLYILRNGIDMVQSRTSFPGFKEFGFLDHCRTWTMNVDQYSYIENYPEFALEIRHDEMVKEPERILLQICELLDLEFHSGPVDFISGTIVHPLDNATKSNVVVKDILKKRKPAWLKWSDEEKDIFKTVCGENMRHVGYNLPF